MPPPMPRDRRNSPESIPCSRKREQCSSQLLSPIFKPDAVSLMRVYPLGKEGSFHLDIFRRLAKNSGQAATQM
jgi:hypothetical protein